MATRNKIKIVPIERNIELMVAFTEEQLRLCYEVLVNYPEVQEDIKRLMNKLKTI